MPIVEVLPGLRLNDTMFELAAAGVAAYTDLDPLTWETFTDVSRWDSVPDDCGEMYKAELLLQRTAKRVRKVNIWFLPDLRCGGRREPHSHPGDMQSWILAAGYTEDRYTRLAGGEIREDLGVEHAGGENFMPAAMFHEVTEIHAPGETISVMEFRRDKPMEWGTLDLDTGEYRPNRPDPDFRARWLALNPHRR